MRLSTSSHFSTSLRVALKVAVCLWASFSLAGCTANSAANSIRLATGSTTGYYYQLGLALENSVEETV
ncbi:MAG: hypothetical protein AAFU53_04975, partial [Cyanobacteria bacterium J06632_3]